MNNQAAQTMPELPEPSMTAFTKADGMTPFWHYDGVPLVREGRRPDSDKSKAIYLYTADQVHQYARDYAASQTAGVAVSDEMVERACKKYAFREDGALWPDAYSEHEVIAERTLMREFLEYVLAAAPAASGGEDDHG